MNAAAKTPDVEELLHDHEAAQAKLRAHRDHLLKQDAERHKRVLEEVERINRALGFDPAKATAAKTPKVSRTPGIGEAVVKFVGGRPWSTIREIQAAFPEHPAPSVESTVRNLAAASKLQKDDSNPRKFALPGVAADSAELSETAARSSPDPKAGAAQPQSPKPSGKG